MKKKIEQKYTNVQINLAYKSTKRTPWNSLQSSNIIISMGRHGPRTARYCTNEFYAGR